MPAKKTTKKTKTRVSKSTKKIEGTWGIQIEGRNIYKDPAVAYERLKHDNVIGFDTETTGLSAWKDNIAILQLFGEQTGTAAIIQTPGGVIPEPIKGLLEDKSKELIVHNGVGFDLMFLNEAGVKWRKSVWYDTLVGETLLASTGRRDVSKSLRESVRRRLGLTIDKDIEHGHWDNDELTERQIEYAIQDVIPLPGLRQEQRKKAEETGQDGALQMEMDLVPYVAQMTINGLPCTKERVREYVEKQWDNIADAEKRLRKKWKFGNINLGSTKQLQDAFAKHHNIHITSTAKDTLIPMSQLGGKAGAIADDLLTYKHGKQRINMYSEAWIEANVVNDRIHPHFWQCSADTTRFTCSNPNLQQIPKDSRGDIIGGVPGTTVVNVDYSQIEVRIAAYVANDTTLLKLLESGDVHTAVAAAVFNTKESSINPRQRKLAKAMVFLLLFGGGVQGFYDYIKMSGGELTYDEAREYVQRFFGTFSGIRAMKERAEKLSRKDGPVFIRLPNGSRRILIGFKKKSTTILNTMVQGTASVGIKHGILEAGRRGLDKYLGGQVHDELVAAVPNKEAKEYAEELKDAMIVGMKQVVNMTVKASPSMGNVWQP